MTDKQSSHDKGSTLMIADPLERPNQPLKNKGYGYGISDPMERRIAVALERAKYAYNHECEIRGRRLDFYVPQMGENGVYIEVKRFHSERISAQMACVANVIVAQGHQAVETLAKLIEQGSVQ